MADRYHVNPHTLRVGQCRAKTRCDFAGAEGKEPPHYDSKEEAQKALDKENQKFAVPGGMKKERQIVLTKTGYERVLSDQKNLQKVLKESFEEVAKVNERQRVFDSFIKEGLFERKNKAVLDKEKELKKDLATAERNQAKASQELSSFKETNKPRIAAFEKKMQQQKEARDRTEEARRIARLSGSSSCAGGSRPTASC